MHYSFIRHIAIFLTSLALSACANDGRTPGEHVDAAIDASGKAVQTAGEATINGLRKVDQVISEIVEPDYQACRNEKTDRTKDDKQGEKEDEENANC